MWSSRWFLFVFFFTVDVRVRASSDFHERPQGCLKNSFASCALQTEKGTFHLKAGGNEFYLGPKSLVLRHSQNLLEFVSGTLWAEKLSGITVRTVFCEVTSKSGPFWILGDDQDRVWIRNVNSDVKIKLRDGRRLEVPVGFQLWIGGADENGKMTSGIPEIIPVEEHIRMWSHLFKGTKQEFASAVENLRWTWGPMPERASQLYMNIAKHQEELVRRRQKAEQKRHLAHEEERKRTKDLFIEKAFFR